MDPLSIFGAITLAVMLVFYMLEDRAPVYTLLFAGTCVLSSIYAFLQGAWPFGVLEIIWTFVALRRWWKYVLAARVSASRDSAG